MEHDLDIEEFDENAEGVGTQTQEEAQDQEAHESETEEEARDTDKEPESIYRDGKILGRFNGPRELAEDYRKLQRKFTQTAQQAAAFKKYALANGWSLSPTGEPVPPSDTTAASRAAAEATENIPEPDLSDIPEPDVETPFWFEKGYQPHTRQSDGNIYDENGVLEITKADWDAYAQELSQDRAYQDEYGNPDAVRIAVALQDARYEVERQRRAQLEANIQQANRYKEAHSGYEHARADRIRASEFSKSQALATKAIEDAGIPSPQEFIKPYLETANKILDGVKASGPYKPGYAEQAIALAIASDYQGFVKAVADAIRGAVSGNANRQGNNGRLSNSSGSRSAGGPNQASNRNVQRTSGVEEATEIVITEGAGQGRPGPGAQQQGQRYTVTDEVKKMAADLGIKSQTNIQKLAERAAKRNGR